jgi:tRNA-Thr(GGU) m(6)t(6)A37 methyltransferase TsaA
MTVVLSTFTGVTAILMVCFWWQRERQLQDVLRQVEERRKEERTGRIRAEVKLRQVTKDLQQIRAQQIIHTNSSNSDGTSKGGTTSTNMLLTSIGTVTSPYTKRMGTPRQPTLVPSSRGFIEFTCPVAALDGIEAYSHIWILFEFHANTNIDKAKTKIRPPRAGGIKVGQLATRSPHRPNCLGLSLVRVEAWKPPRLHIRGLDLVNGTPVFDVKPCVPWDVPTKLVVPNWVDQDDTVSQVIFSETAKDQLKGLVQQGSLDPLYAAGDTDAALQTLSEILAQDPRSSHKGLKQNARGTTSDKNAYNLVFGSCRVFFFVENDGVFVERIEEFDLGENATFVDGVPLFMESETNK